MKKEKHTRYNYQFKHTAVSVSKHPDIQSQDVAEALSIHPFMLSRWRKQMKDGVLANNDKEARSRTALQKAQQQITTLETKLKRVQEENTILKKAERFFPGKK